MTHHISSSRTERRLFICFTAFFIGASLFLLLTAPYMRAQINSGRSNIEDLYGALQSAQRLSYGTVGSVDVRTANLRLVITNAFGEARSLRVHVGTASPILRETLQVHNGLYDALTAAPATLSDIAPGDRIAVLLSGDPLEASLVLFGNPL